MTRSRCQNLSGQLLHALVRTRFVARAYRRPQTVAFGPLWEQGTDMPFLAIEPGYLLRLCIRTCAWGIVSTRTRCYQTAYTENTSLYGHGSPTCYEVECPRVLYAQVAHACGRACKR